MNDITSVSIGYTIYNDYIQEWALIRHIDVYSESKGVLSPPSIKIGKYTIREKDKVNEDALIDIVERCRKYEVNLEDLSRYSEHFEEE